MVVDHDTGGLVWAGPGRNDAALHVFFDELGPNGPPCSPTSALTWPTGSPASSPAGPPNAVRCAVPAGDEGKEALRRWLIWARRSQLPAFVDLHRKITAHRAAIEATLDHGLSNALIESTNTKIRLLTRSLSDSTATNHSSPSPYSPSAATHPDSPADDPRIQQKSDISAGVHLGPTLARLRAGITAGVGRGPRA